MRIKSLGVFPRIPQGSALTGHLSGSFETMTTSILLYATWLFPDANKINGPLFWTNHLFDSSEKYLLLHLHQITEFDQNAADKASWMSLQLNAGISLRRDIEGQNVLRWYDFEGLFISSSHLQYNQMLLIMLSFPNLTDLARYIRYLLCVSKSSYPLWTMNPCLHIN